MPPYRSRTTTHGRNMAGARSLWLATGMKHEDFKKPIIAIANSFTQFVPGHVHLKDLGQMVAEEIYKAGGVGREFHTIAVDDGIAMGHTGMLYSLPSRELIADSVEYMVNAHWADALICISNCDKITPGMFMAAMRLNIPTIFISGGPMEAGKVNTPGAPKSVDIVDTMILAANPNASDAAVEEYEKHSCPTCGSCSVMGTANSMNSLIEALGLGLPGNGTLIATHADRKEMFLEAARKIVELAKRYYEKNDSSALPRNIATFQAFENAMMVDMAMGGSTNTVLHMLAAAQEGEVPFTIDDIDRLSRQAPNLCKVAPSIVDIHIEDVHRAGGVFGIMGELDRMGLIHRNTRTVHAATTGDAIDKWDIRRSNDGAVHELYKAAPGGVRTLAAFGSKARYTELDMDRVNGAIRDKAHAYNLDGGLAVLYGNIAEDGALIKTAGVHASMLDKTFAGPARVFHSMEATCMAILGKKINPGDVVVILYEGPKGGPGMQEMLYPTGYLKSMGLEKVCALVTDGRFSGGSTGLSVGHISPEAAEGGNIGLVEEGDIIEIDIPTRAIKLRVSDAILKQRRAAMEAKGDQAWQPVRNRQVTAALKAYGALTTSASRGAVRDLNQRSGKPMAPQPVKDRVRA